MPAYRPDSLATNRDGGGRGSQSNGMARVAKGLQAVSQRMDTPPPSADPRGTPTPRGPRPRQPVSTPPHPPDPAPGRARPPLAPAPRPPLPPPSAPLAPAPAPARPRPSHPRPRPAHARLGPDQLAGSARRLLASLGIARASRHPRERPPASGASASRRDAKYVAR